jgi:hypothetical protein
MHQRRKGFGHTRKIPRQVKPANFYQSCSFTEQSLVTALQGACALDVQLYSVTNIRMRT